MPDWTHELPSIPARPSRALLFVAMRDEATPIARALSLAPGPDGLLRGDLGGLEVELVVPGADPALGIDRIGPSFAAWALTRAIAVRRPEIVVNMGTAGGFHARGLAIADLVLARDAMFHDARVALPGFDALARGHARLSSSDAQLDGISRALDARVGLVSSGASLDATAAELALFAHMRTHAKDMELAALAAVCHAEGLPLVALKGVTDLVDHHEPAHEAFMRNLARTSERLAAAAQGLFRALQGG